jgi:hypothetical protein
MSAARCKCGSTEYRDTPIHGGQSMRRDCARCFRFVEFAVWYGQSNEVTQPAAAEAQPQDPRRTPGTAGS